MKVVFCTPTVARPFDAYLDAIAASVPLLDAAGIDHKAVYEVSNPYIGGARSTMLRKALDGKADAVVFIDHDISWQPRDLLTLIETPGDVVAGTYRFKKDEEEYMGGIESDAAGRPMCRQDGCIRATCVPAGFLKVTKEAVEKFMEAYPGLVYGPRYNPSVDLFNHGAIDGVWYGEDYAFSKRWCDCGWEIWIVPNLSIDHHAPTQVFKGNYHEHLLRQPGGSKDPARSAPSLTMVDALFPQAIEAA